MSKQIFLFFLLYLFSYFASAAAPPLGIYSERASRFHHVEHSSIDQLKNNRPKPVQSLPIDALEKPALPLHNIKKRSYYSPPMLDSKFPLLTSSDEPTIHDSCYSGFAEKTGEELIEHIESVDDYNCLYHLFYTAPLNIRVAAFRTDNMIYAARKAKELGVYYEGQGNDLLRRLYVFLRTGYYNDFYNEGELDWDERESKSRIDQAIVSAADDFINNPHFYNNVNSGHGDVLSEFLINTDNVNRQSHFMPTWIALLKQVDSRYTGRENWSMRRSVNEIFYALFRGHSNRTEFHSAITDNRELIHTLRDFTFSDFALEPELHYLASNASLELSRFLMYDGDREPRINVYNELVRAVRDILDRYGVSPNGEGIKISVSALSSIFFLGKCQEFNVCGVDEELERQVLSTPRECSSSETSTVALIRHQNFSEEKLDDICAAIMEQDKYFHETFETSGQPVQDDYNTQLEVVIFDKSDSYQTYSFLFFGNDSNNGGIYLEGDPSDSSNTARFIAYLADWLPEEPVWNLEHEYVHYLDGRFNLYGNFGDYKTNTHHTVWWAEGLAEYLSKKDKHEWAARLLEEDDEPELSFIFKTNYSSSAELIYPWSYLAVRFMMEQYSSEIQRFLGYFKQGAYDGYKRYVENIESKYDEEFSNWLGDIEDLADQEENIARRSHIRLRSTDDRSDSVTYDLTDSEQNYYIDIPEDAEVTALSSEPEIAEAILIDNQTLVITPLSPGIAFISVTVTVPDQKPVTYLFRIPVVQGFRFIPDETFTLDNGRIHKHLTPPSLSICDKTRTIDLSKYVDLSDYPEGYSLPDTVSFSIGVNYSENIARAAIEGSLLTITALQAGSTSIWINMQNQETRVDEIYLDMEITGDSAQCDEETDDDEDDDDDSRDGCRWVRVGRIWFKVCN